MWNTLNILENDIKYESIIEITVFLLCSNKRWHGRGGSGEVLVQLSTTGSWALYQASQPDMGLSDSVPTPEPAQNQVAPLTVYFPNLGEGDKNSGVGRMYRR